MTHMRMRKKKTKTNTYSEGFFFETRMFGDEAHAKTRTMQIGRTFRRMHATGTDVTDVIARARNGNAAAGRAYPRRAHH